jgi:hypothetical protein
MNQERTFVANAAPLSLMPHQQQLMILNPQQRRQTVSGGI